VSALLGYRIEGIRGGDWVAVPEGVFEPSPQGRAAAEDRADVLADLVTDSGFRVVDLATGDAVYTRVKVSGSR